MNSIKSRLIRVFLIIISVTTVGSLVFFGLNLIIIRQYKAISDLMIAEYSLVNTSSELIAAYNTRIQSAGTDVSISDTKIQEAKSEIHDLIRFLDRNITSVESRSNYLGLKNSVENLVSLIDDSIGKVKEQNIVDYVDDYNKANQIYGFVRENGTNLIFSELKYTSVVSRQIDLNSIITAIFDLSALAALSIVSVVFCLRFARALASPLTTLTAASTELAHGNMEIVIDPNILERTDEVGILAKSFNTMAIRLREKVGQLDQAKGKLEENLKEVERMNSVMIGRELTMIELKKEIDKLKANPKS